jgi:hypothetical protein
MALRTNRTEPSHMDAFTPCVWKLREEIIRDPLVVPAVRHRGRFG